MSSWPKKRAANPFGDRDCFRQAIVESESKNEDTWNIPTISREEVRIVMERFLCSLVDRRLRLMDFLDDLRH